MTIGQSEVPCVVIDGTAGVVLGAAPVIRRSISIICGFGAEDISFWDAVIAFEAVVDPEGTFFRMGVIILDEVACFVPFAEKYKR